MEERKKEINQKRQVIKWLKRKEQKKKTEEKEKNERGSGKMKKIGRKEDYEEQKEGKI